jgi:hypothetical protein
MLLSDRLEHFVNEFAEHFLALLVCLRILGDMLDDLLNMGHESSDASADWKIRTSTLKKSQLILIFCYHCRADE